MICINCGRPLPGKICDYCGSDYRTDEEKKGVECNHLFDSVMYEEHPVDMTGALIFKCRYCNHTAMIRTSRDIFRSIAGRW